MRFEISPKADAELSEASRYLQKQQSGLGERFLDEVGVAIQAALDHPLRWPIFELEQSLFKRRRVRINGFPYVLLYEVFEEVLLVSSVLHLSRGGG